MSAAVRSAPFLLLEDGAAFPGVWRGCPDVEAVGEACFNTSMSGYQEILTDPSYTGQVVVMTCPEIGNYGTNAGDMESRRVHCRGFVVRELSEVASNWAAESSLEDFLRAWRIPCLSEVDTRALTRHLRDRGAMRCAFVRDESGRARALAALRGFDYGGLDLTVEASGATTLLPEQDPSKKSPRVAVLDFGVKANILRLLAAFARVEVHTLRSFDALGPAGRDYDGFFLSNGPGNPEAVAGASATIRRILAWDKPLFGICLGHQLLSLALGGATYKLKFGHRGANHPVKDLSTGKVEITSQNHGYAVRPESFPAAEKVAATHVNLNDGSLEGLRLEGRPVYSIQYHPEASPGPHDSNHLFNRFREDLARAAGAAD